MVEVVSVCSLKLSAPTSLCPHWEQNFAVGGFSCPHSVQNGMGSPHGHTDEVQHQVSSAG